jgi:hypothetical protein
MWVAASEAAVTARAVSAQDFLLKLEGPSFSGPFSPSYGSCPPNPGTGHLRPLARRGFDDLPARGLPSIASQAGPGNDINAGSPGSQKAPP